MDDGYYIIISWPRPGFAIFYKKGINRMRWELNGWLTTDG